MAAAYWNNASVWLSHWEANRLASGAPTTGDTVVRRSSMLRTRALSVASANPGSSVNVARVNRTASVA